MDNRELIFLIEQFLRKNKGLDDRPSSKNPMGTTDVGQKEAEEIYKRFLHEILVTYVSLLHRHETGEPGVEKRLNQMLKAMEWPLKPESKKYFKDNLYSEELANKFEELVDGKNIYFIRKLSTLSDDFLRSKITEKYGVKPPIKEGRRWKFPKVMYS